ncbi:uncharacterized protein [Dermacentor albipictus]|uniref:uncharacterized protein isoform X2 n=1 Tax=Dermacentor albipictus TaxID=60249 RepID=UPI0038FC3C0E
MSNSKESVHENTADEESKVPEVPKARSTKRNEKNKTAPLDLPPPLPEFMRDNAAACAVPASSNTGGQSSSSAGSGAPNRHREGFNNSQREDTTGRERPRHDGCSLPKSSNCPAHEFSFLPEGGLARMTSKTWRARLGVFTVVPFGRGHRFGPYTKSTANHNGIREAAKQPAAADAIPQGSASAAEVALWINYVNCAPDERQCNLIVLEEAGSVYYEICAPIERSTELLVWCTKAPPFRRLQLEEDIEGEEGDEEAQNDQVNDVPEADTSNGCHVCDKEHKSQLALERHLRTHITLKPFKCDKCPEGFSQAVQLQRHEKIHTEEYLYKCHECGRKFAMVAAFKCHVPAHEKTKQFACVVCGKTFARKCDSVKHRMTAHRES